jgi:GT2 family glycosyltransferase
MTEISVILPTYNRLPSLKRVLDGLDHQTVPSHQFEVLIVSDGSSDGTHEFLQGLEKPYSLTYIHQPNQGVAAARNNGVAYAAGWLILFLDDDVVPAPQLIQEHLSFQQQYGDMVVVIGPMLNPPDHKMSPWVRWEQAQLAKQYQDMNTGHWEPTARQFYTGNTSLARAHLLASGGFDPSFRRAEDVELAYRLASMGLRFLFNPQAVGYHYAARSFKSWMSTPYNYGRNDVVFATHKEQHWLLGTIFEEFHTRHLLIRGLTKLCLDHPWLTRAIHTLLSAMIKSGERLDLPWVSDLACSGLFNLRYYQGVTDGLAGREAFLAGISGSTQSYGNFN